VAGIFCLKNSSLSVAGSMLLHGDTMLISYGAHFVGGYDKRLRENVEYLEELKRLAVAEGVDGQVRFVTSCSTSERNKLLSNCLCVLYTPKVNIFLS
jgi:alpha-1,3/alpha-1,6-mannosyltransferase